MAKFMVKNAKIWTANKAAGWAESMLIDGERIACIGSNQQVLEQLGREEQIEILDMKDKMILPSFIDPHIHVTAVAKSQWYFLLQRENCQTKEQLLVQIKQYAEEHSRQEVPYIYATSCPGGWMDVMTKKDLDAVVDDRPVLLCDDGFHRCLVNSKMLALMEIDQNTPYDISSSRNYGRDADGTPNGLVYEHCYELDITKMYQKIGWYPPNQKDCRVIAPFMQKLGEWGIGAMMDGFTEGTNTFKGMSAMEQKGLLNQYYFGNVIFHTLDDLEEAIQRLKRWKSFESKHVRVSSLKLFLDGTNEIETSAVLEPFCDSEGRENYGIINLSEDELMEAMIRISQEKLDLQIHLVGDRSFRVAINAVERAQNELKNQGERFQSQVTLLHCELTKPVDRFRVKKLGIYINITPHWNGGSFGNASLAVLGEERFQSMYAFNDMIQDGAVVSCSSDVVDLEDMNCANPFVGIEIGHTRRNLSPDAPVRSSKEECITRENLLYGYTIQAARCVRMEQEMGSLEVGKLANFNVISDNVFEVAAREIHKIHVEHRYFEGKPVF